MRIRVPFGYCLLSFAFLLQSAVVWGASSASFLGCDSVSLGNWQGKYGRTGYVVPGGASSYSNEVQVDWDENVESYIWEESTKNRNGLQDPEIESARVAGARFVGSGPLRFSVDTGSESKKITLYFCDWDRNNRQFQIRILNSDDEILDEVVLGSAWKGIYLSWAVQGKVRFVIAPLAPSTNAILNGLFIDPLAKDDRTPPLAKSDGVKPKNILLFAGLGSHSYASHEHNAGMIYLKQVLESAANVRCRLFLNVRPGIVFDPENVDALVVFADGDGSYPLTGQSEKLRQMMRRGCGFVFLHYATLPNQDAVDSKVVPNPDFDLVKESTGGVYEKFLTVNPFFTGEFRSFVAHPITRGVKPFAIYDEWYFSPRLIDNLGIDEALAQGASAKVVPILSCVPPDVAKTGDDGPYSGNPTVRSRLGKPEIVAWATQRPDGGRGFGFTGGDIHWNFANRDYRKILINGILWSAGCEVPADGFKTPDPTFEQLQRNQDDPDTLTPAKKDEIREMISRFPHEGK